MSIENPLVLKQSPGSALAQEDFNFLKMYEVPGYGKFSQKDYERYLRSRDRLKKGSATPSAVNHVLDDSNSEDEIVERHEKQEVDSESALLEELIKSPLYKDQNINNQEFSRTQLEKTGSGTTLIGGHLKDKIITRHLDGRHFLKWLDAYEAWETWQKEGFDYVPIEPIASFWVNKKEGEVNVSSGVLDLNLKQWLEKTGGKFKEEPQKARSRIVEVMENTLNIKHGPVHEANFALRFFRDSDGKPLLDKVPRIYMIDFDRAADMPEHLRRTDFTNL